MEGRLQVIDASGGADFLDTVGRLRGAHAAAVTIDASRPPDGQAARAAFAAQLSGAPRIVVALNENMDLAGYAREAFERAGGALARLSRAGGVPAPRLVPVSARDGELVVRRGGRALWYDGPTLLEALLESVPAR